MTIGEAGVPHDDLYYTGETGDSVFSMQYYRNKISEFQVALNQADTVAQSAQRVIDLTYDTYDMQNSGGNSPTQELMLKIEQLNAKKSELRTIAEAINLGAAAANAMGGRMPQVSMPMNLGIAPIVLGAGTIAAIVAGSAAVGWVIAWASDVGEIMQRYVTLYAVSDPVKRDALAAELAKVDQSIQIAQSSPIAAFSNIVKWLVIGGAAFLMYQIYQKRGH